MLSRVANNFYWMGRYMERTRCLSRLLLIQIQEMPEDSSGFLSASWKGLFYTLKIPALGGGFLIDEKESSDLSDDFLMADAYTLLDYLTFESHPGGSLLNYLERIRENARQNREKITSLMWPHINKTYLNVKNQHLEDLWPDKMIDFYKSLLESVYFFYGLVEDSLYHNEGFFFIQMGRYIERLQNTSGIIESHIRFMLHHKEEDSDLTGLLLRCEAFDNYRQVHSLDFRFRKVIHFLFYDLNFSASLIFSARRLREYLSFIEKKNKVNSSVYKCLEEIEKPLQSEALDRPLVQILSFLYKRTAKLSDTFSNLYLMQKDFDSSVTSDQ